MTEAILGALVTAVIGGLGFLLKRWYERRGEARREAQMRWGRLQELQLMLRESAFLFTDQNEKTRRLMSSLMGRFPDQVGADGFDANFQRLYDKFNDAEQEIHRLIRGLTMTALYSVNARMREWLVRNPWARAGDEVPQDLATALVRLQQHLDGWLSKYAVTIPENPKAALVYMADEKRQGVGFPSELEPALEAYMATRV